MISWLFYFGIKFVLRIYMHIVYLIYSQAYDLYYVGQTQDITNRLLEHNKNRCRFTKGKGPWIIIGTKSYTTRSEAMRAEKRMKKMKNRNYILQYFKNEA